MALGEQILGTVQSVVGLTNDGLQAYRDLKFMVWDEYCSYDTFWENVGHDRKLVCGRLNLIGMIEDEGLYNKSLRKLMNEYI